MSIMLSGNLSKNFTQREYHKGNAAVVMSKETIVFIRAIQTFRNWLAAPMYVVSWARTVEENKAVGGIATSNHLLPRACAMDFNRGNGVALTKADFIKWATKWAAICRATGCVPEAGLYAKGWIHFGIQNSAQAKANKNQMVHWYTDANGKQINNPYPELRGL